MARRDRPESEGRVVVLGLGRFGVSLARELVRRGSDVLGIDNDAGILQHYADELTHAAVADTTDAAALRQLDVHTAARAVVGIGTDLEASILTTSVLVDFEVPHIWAKATSRQHGRILERIGAHHVVLPEQEMGQRVAHLVTGRMIDFIRFEDDFAMAKTSAPAHLVGRPLGHSRLRTKDRITVVGIKKRGQEFTYATADTVAEDGDVIIVSGRIDDVEAFANDV
ncbi:potassium channel family protein [Pseudonocardia pini]|uniref:potassium channel family protein n=1 Tax=Pseudonocardia pini TaxID=2758030 RepID=UPI0015F11770|nr:TrkA family potassium uptake protein [Pseudonocardia pini]